MEMPRSSTSTCDSIPLPFGSSIGLNLSQDRVGDRRGLAHLGDVVDTEDVGAGGKRRDQGGVRPAAPLLDPRPVDLADEALARGADDQRPPQLAQLADVVDTE